MKLRIDHITQYDYSSVISLGVHKLYLLPQFRTYLSVSSQKLSISPQPLGMSDRIDLPGNSYKQTWFNGPTDFLKIRTIFFKGGFDDHHSCFTWTYSSYRISRVFVEKRRGRNQNRGSSILVLKK